MRMLDRDPAQRPTMEQAGAELRAIADSAGRQGSTGPAGNRRRRGLALFAGDRRQPGTVAVGDDPPMETAVLGDVQQGVPAADGGRLETSHFAADGPPTGIAALGGDEERRESAAVGDGHRRPVVVGGGVLALAAVLAVVITLMTTSHGGTPTPSTASSPGGRSAPPAASAHQGTTSAPVTPSSALSSAAAPPLSPSASPSTSQALADQLTGTIVDYYHLLPGNLDQAWGWMTADYQQNHAGGRANYNSFWQPVQRVTVTDAVASLPSGVDATLVYYYQDGRVVQERTRFGLVRDQGQWKIAQTSVLSSSGG
jgi:hypothetical protein